MSRHTPGVQAPAGLGQLGGAGRVRELTKTIEEKLGAEHPSTLMSVNDLAGILQDQGELAEAKVYLLRDQGKLAETLKEVEPLYRQAMERRERTLGADHPCNLVSLNNLVDVFQDQGKLAEAEPYIRRALERREAPPPAS